jgi:hypothetical protein
MRRRFSVGCLMVKGENIAIEDCLNFTSNRFSLHSFLIHNWDSFVVAMSQICGQSFKALASNLSKFGFNRQKNREQNPQQRFYVCPPGFDIMSRFEDLKKVTSKTNKTTQHQQLESNSSTFRPQNFLKFLLFSFIFPRRSQTVFLQFPLKFLQIFSL